MGLALSRHAAQDKALPRILGSIPAQALPLPCDAGEAGPVTLRLQEGPELQAGDRVTTFNNRNRSQKEKLCNLKMQEEIAMNVFTLLTQVSGSSVWHGCSQCISRLQMGRKLWARRCAMFPSAHPVLITERETEACRG